MTGTPEKPRISRLRNVGGYAVMAVLLFFFLGASLIFKPRHLLRPIKALARLMLRTFGFRIHVSGVANPGPSATYLYMSNHISMFDHFIALGYVPGYLVGLETHETSTIPVYGWAAKRWGQIYIDRGSTWSSLEGYRLIKDRLAAGINVLLFPEGYRTRDGKLRPFKTTPFQIAVETRATVIPIVLKGLFPLCPRRSKMFASGDVELHFAEPIAAGSGAEARDALAAEVRVAMLDRLDEAGRQETGQTEPPRPAAPDA